MGFPYHGTMVLVWCSYTTLGMGTIEVPLNQEFIYLIGTLKWVTEVPTLQYVPFLPSPPLNLMTLSPPNSMLMQWAEGGSLDDFIDIRLGRKPSHIHIHAPGSTNADYKLGAPAPPPLRRSGNPAHMLSASDLHSRSARIRTFQAFQRVGSTEGKREREKKKRNGKWTAVHLLSADEVKGLFKDVVVGLGFLVLFVRRAEYETDFCFNLVKHNKSILHLDLKPGNVLLTWDEGKLMYFFSELHIINADEYMTRPCTMLLDFGTSRDMINSTRLQHSRNTGT